MQASKAERKQASINAYWQQRHQDLIAQGTPAFVVENQVKKEQSQVKLGKLVLPPEVVDPDLVTATTVKKPFVDAPVPPAII